MTTGLRPHCTFEVAGLLLGLDVVDVQEVVPHRRPTRVPTAPAWVEGLINLRGQIVTVLDLAECLGLRRGARSDRPMNVVARTDGGSLGLVVDEVCDIREVDLAALERPPETLDEPIRRRITGLSPLGDRSLLVLDIARLVDHC